MSEVGKRNKGFNLELKELQPQHLNYLHIVSQLKLKLLILMLETI